MVLATLSVLAQAPAASASATTRQRLGVSRRLDDARSVDAHLFEPGACMEFPPTSGDRHLTVFLDAGHGGIDPGGVGQDENGNTVYEKDITLAVELDTVALLSAKGFTVVVSRTTDETVSRPQPDDVSGGLFTAQGVHDDVAARDECADMAKADLLVGVYFDAGAYSSNAGSVTGYDSARPFTAQNEKFANLLQNDVLSAMNAQGWQIPSLGAVDDSQLGGPALTEAAGDYGHLLLLGPAVPGWFSTPSTMPGALIEPLFITDPFEADIAEGSSGQHVIAAGMAQAVEQYFAPPPGGQNSEKGKPTRHRTMERKAA
ncbi:MAG TPA: N-acetylmuramoyl-L-alanine amidase [Acidimicrobiales bacterium]